MEQQDIFKGYKSSHPSLDSYYIYAGQFKYYFLNENYNKAIISLRELVGYRNPYEKACYEFLEEVFKNDVEVL